MSGFLELDDARASLKAAGAAGVHEERVLRLWAQARPQDSRKRRIDAYFPNTLRTALPGIVQSLEAVAQLESAHPAADGSERLLVKLHDGQMVESVLLPRGGLCISSQVGCAVGCVFCMTGKSGLLRQLGSAEMVAQVALARTRRPVSKVVFMGMGEPSHNLDAVLEAIDFLGTTGDVGHKNLVFSTVGDPRAFERLPQGRVKPALALSLHTTDAALRLRLLPRAPRLSPGQLVEAADEYARATGYPVQYQWTLLEGINDTAQELEGIEKLFAGRFGVLNLIPFNAVEGMPFSRPALEHAQAFARDLKSRNILTKLRNSAGQDVDGGCGQLRARAEGSSRVLSPLPRGEG